MLCPLLCSASNDKVSAHACCILPRWLGSKESACQCRRCRFDPCIGKIPWRRKWLPSLVFLPGESLRQRSLESSMGSQRVGHYRATKQAHTTSLTINSVPVFIAFASMINAFFPGDKDPGKNNFYPLALAGLVARIPGFIQAAWLCCVQLYLTL